MARGGPSCKCYSFSACQNDQAQLLLRTRTHHNVYYLVCCNPGKCSTRCVASFRLKGDPAKFEPARFSQFKFQPLDDVRTSCSCYEARQVRTRCRYMGLCESAGLGFEFVSSSYFLRAWNYFRALDSILIPLQECSGCCSLPFQRIADSAQQGSGCFQDFQT